MSDFATDFHRTEEKAHSGDLFAVKSMVRFIEGQFLGLGTAPALPEPVRNRLYSMFCDCRKLQEFLDGVMAWRDAA